MQDKAGKGWEDNGAPPSEMLASRLTIFSRWLGAIRDISVWWVDHPSSKVASLAEDRYSILDPHQVTRFSPACWG